MNILRIIFLGCILFGASAEIVFAQDKSESSHDKFLLLRAKLPSLQTHELFVWQLDFAPGAVIGEHTHPGQEVLLVTEGLLSVEVDGNKTIVEPGEVLLVPAGSKMSVQNLKTGATSRALQVIVANRGQRPQKMVTE
ncbi:MAG: cupin domain-containing protein [Pseudomonadota bacterium]